MVYTLRFILFEMQLVHNSNVFGSCIIHILYTGCAKIKKKIIQKVKTYSGGRAWKAIHDRLRRPYYLSRVDHVRKIRDRKQRTDTGKCSFVNRTIKNWNQLHSLAGSLVRPGITVCVYIYIYLKIKINVILQCYFVSCGV